MFLAAARSNQTHTLHFAMLTGDDAKLVKQWQDDNQFPLQHVTIPNVPTFNILNPGFTNFPSLWWTKSDVHLYFTRQVWQWGPRGSSIPPTSTPPTRTSNITLRTHPIYVCMDFSSSLSPILCLDPNQPPPPAFIDVTPLPCSILKFAQFPPRRATYTSTYNVVVTQDMNRDDQDPDVQQPDQAQGQVYV